MVDPSQFLYLNYYIFILNFLKALSLVWPSDERNVSSTEGGLHDHVATMTSIDPQTKQPQRKKSKSK